MFQGEDNSEEDTENEIISEQYESVLSPLASSVTTTSSGYKTPSVRRSLKRTKKAEEVLDIVAQKLQQPPEEVLKFDSFGKHVAEQMRSVDEKQGFYLSKIINDAIFEAQCGNLSKNSRIVTPLEVTVNNQPPVNTGFIHNNQPPVHAGFTLYDQPPVDARFTPNNPPPVNTGFTVNNQPSTYLNARNTLSEDDQYTNKSLADYFSTIKP